MIKRNYELTLVLDTNFSSSDISNTIKGCEEIIGLSNIVETDNIGLLTTAYPIRGQNQAYYVSYLLEINPELIPVIESELHIIKGLAKSFIYNAIPSKFTTFGDMQKRYTEVFPVEEEEEEVAEDDSSDINVE